ncbi:hypothetical protein M0638_14060 [Roseomonas sp. NAR14]|uniref:Lipoprotein n=1 Tax=Roseomonas acroporae TaxID=2937791 RepID=A0A9X1YAS8_9PROT|nr:hypothetical protein [Roseomonas acroporae]MCK8785510.1 hypothetical protein [Roseomonas acroporae]
MSTRNQYPYRRSSRRALLAFGAAFGLLAGCASQPTPTPPPAAAGPSASTEGTVTFSTGGVALGVGMQRGNGVLTFRGREYPFTIRGLSVVDVGISQNTGTGRVRNLNNVADFNGNYVAAAVGATVAGGGGATTLRNQNGVTIEVLSTSRGARVTLAPAGVIIELAQ